MAEIKWIKLSTDLFDNRKIKMIEQMPDGDAMIVIWLQLLILAGQTNDGGCVYFTKDIPYTEQLLSMQFRRPLATIQMALRTFENFGMIEIVDSVIMVSNWEKYQSAEKLDKVREQTRERVAKYRERQRLGCNVTSNADVTQSNATEKEIEQEIELEKEKETKKRPAEPSVASVLADADLREDVKEALKEFSKMRTKIKAGMTPNAMKLLIGSLKKLSEEPETQIAIINQSIVNSWKNVYPLKKAQEEPRQQETRKPKFNDFEEHPHTPESDASFEAQILKKQREERERRRKEKND